MVQRLRRIILRLNPSMKGMIDMRIIKSAAVAALCLLAAVSLCGCGKTGSIDDYLQQHKVELESSYSDAPEVSTGDAASSSDVSGSDVSGSDVSGSDVSASDVTTTTTTTKTTAAPADVTSTLPEQFIGSWAVIDIYQEAGASDISAEEALRREQMTGISFGSNSFDRSGESVHGASFRVNRKAGFKDMESFGISTKPLVGPYGSDAEIISVEVLTADGMTCTTVFLINNTTLVAFGSGMNVFTYELMNAVG